MFKSVFFFLLTHFAAGLIVCALFVSIREIGRSYFRLISSLGVLLFVFALLVEPFPFSDFREFLVLKQGMPIPQQLTYLGAVVTIIFLILYNIFIARAHIIVLGVAAFSALVSVAAFSLATYAPILNTGLEGMLFALIGVSSALLLGTILGAMITGHWYLVQHDLSLKPLKATSLLFVGAVVFKMLLLAITLTYYSWGEQTNLLAKMLDFDFEGYIFVGRVAIGLVIPLIFGIMVWNAVKIRSTQSATGILYATIVLILIGETFAKFLYYLNGSPL